jgi:hypothetical protein
MELGPAFLTPDALVDPAGLAGVLRLVGEEAIVGLTTRHYTVRQAELEQWKDLQLNLWRDEASGATLAYDLLLSGPDPIFDGGEGMLAGRFRVTALGPQSIEPILSCEIDLPLPEDAARLVRLPGLVAFDSAQPAEGLAAFYQAQLPAAGWQPAAEPETRQGATVLSFQRSAEALTVNIEAMASGAHVELLVGG